MPLHQGPCPSSSQTGSVILTCGLSMVLRAFTAPFRTLEKKE